MKHPVVANMLNVGVLHANILYRHLDHVHTKLAKLVNASSSLYFDLAFFSPENRAFPKQPPECVNVKMPAWRCSVFGKNGAL